MPSTRVPLGTLLARLGLCPFGDRSAALDHQSVDVEAGRLAALEAHAAGLDRAAAVAARHHAARAAARRQHEAALGPPDGRG
jgi:hypothetical protein